MLTLDNFEEQINKEILQRGRSYFHHQAVISLEEINDNQWEAEVEGSEVYTVEVFLRDKEIINYSCNCPYDEKNPRRSALLEELNKIK